ncbi:MAG TPA: lysylphosphatidylglycerol synthase transmembrane domain-containing protein [Acidimicrobiales bacterium]|nr:lysylphosphatidylglycerol synthase transmembrane domain-containing protein [Acidimicrobiales bacterium]
MTDPALPPSDDNTQPRRSGRLRQAIRVVVSLALAGAILAYVLGSAADFSEVSAAISSMTGLELLTLGIIAVWNLATYWMVVVAATPGLTYPQSAVLVESTTAVANSVPGGSAVAVGLTYAMLGSWGFSRSRSTLSVIVSGLWNNFAKLGLPVLALALLALQGDVNGARVTAGVFGIGALVGSIAVFALILRRESFARRAGDGAAAWVSRLRRRLGKGPVEGWGDATAKFRGRTIGLVSHAWKRLTVATIVSHLSLFAVLLMALRHIGVANAEVHWAQVLAVFAFVRLLTAIPITPGGLGVVELGLIAGLTAAGGAEAQVVAAVLIFRALTYLLPIPVGLLTYLFWRHNTSWRDSAPPLSPGLAPEPAGG